VAICCFVRVAVSCWFKNLAQFVGRMWRVLSKYINLEDVIVPNDIICCRWQRRKVNATDFLPVYIEIAFLIRMCLFLSKIKLFDGRDENLIFWNQVLELEI